ncbi:hypothetical protein CK203_072318 [Vitis vinifera]|uniref:VOC domain-containing protein n=1 Tax=Vitis vinifera TaxID=29760 RepID=A0A438E8C6_VITVI|nr:hypothetical protein CK203_072318 [Vitis vinifera]
MSHCFSMASLLNPYPTSPLQHKVSAECRLQSNGLCDRFGLKSNWFGGLIPDKFIGVLYSILAWPSDMDLVNRFSLNTISRNLLSNRNQLTVRNGPTHGHRLITTAKMSVEGDVMVKEAISTDQKNGLMNLQRQPPVSVPIGKILATIDKRESFFADSSMWETSSQYIGIVSLHHVGILCENLERSFDFYHNLLGFPVNEARPNDKLPYRGAWLWVGSEMIHLMELPNPDPLTGRPEHGGRDRHACIAIRDVSKLKEILDEAGIPYTLSKSGRPAIFTRDPDANALEFVQVDA